MLEQVGGSQQSERFGGSADPEFSREAGSPAALSREAREWLQRVAAKAEALQLSNRKLLARVSEMEGKLPSLDSFTDEQLLAELPGRTGRVLKAAHAVGKEIVDRAEQRAVVVTAEAREEAVRIRHGAETDARNLLRSAATEADAQVAAAYAYGKEVIAKARIGRDKLLAELAKERKALQVELEELKGTRSKLLQAYAVLRQTFEQSIDALEDTPQAEPNEPAMAGDPPLRNRVVDWYQRFIPERAPGTTRADAPASLAGLEDVLGLGSVERAPAADAV